jgi:hypothetical protein
VQNSGNKRFRYLGLIYANTPILQYSNTPAQFYLQSQINVTPGGGIFALAQLPDHRAYSSASGSESFSSERGKTRYSILE